jgi:hypothetical protein
MLQTIKIKKFSSENAVRVPVEMHLGKEFNNAILAAIETKNGLYYDMLFNSEGKPFNKDIFPGLFRKIEETYNKNFELVNFDGNDIWCQQIFLRYNG